MWVRRASTSSRWRAEIVYAASHEGARHLDDVLARRTHIAIERADRGLRALDEIAGLMARPLGWDADQAAREAGHYRAGVAAELASEQAATDAEAGALRDAVPDIVPVLAAGDGDGTAGDGNGTAGDGNGTAGAGTGGGGAAIGRLGFLPGGRGG